MTKQQLKRNLTIMIVLILICFFSGLVAIFFTEFVAYMPAVSFTLFVIGLALYLVAELVKHTFWVCPSCNNQLPTVGRGAIDYSIKHCAHCGAEISDDLSALPPK